MYLIALPKNMVRKSNQFQLQIDVKTIEDEKARKIFTFFKKKKVTFSSIFSVRFETNSNSKGKTSGANRSLTKAFFLRRRRKKVFFLKKKKKAIVQYKQRSYIASARFGALPVLNIFFSFASPYPNAVHVVH